MYGDAPSRMGNGTARHAMHRQAAPLNGRPRVEAIGSSLDPTTPDSKSVVDLVHDDQEVERPDRPSCLDAFRRDDFGQPIQYGVPIGDEGPSGTEDRVNVLDRTPLDLSFEIALRRVTEVRPEGPDASDRVGAIDILHGGQPIARRELEIDSRS